MELAMQDLQALGSPCHLHPSSCMAASLAARALGRLPECVLDLTYGRGRFYAAWDPVPCVIAVDPARRGWIVAPCLYLQARAEEAASLLPAGRLPCRPDLVVADPPWMTRAYSGRPEYAAASDPERVLEAAWRWASTLHAPLLAHYKDRWVPRGARVLAEAYWTFQVTRTMRRPSRSWWGLLAPLGGGAPGSSRGRGPLRSITGGVVLG